MPMTRHHQRGLTLIELMIGLVIGLLVIGMVSALFLNTTRSYRQDERVSGLNDELRFALGELIGDVEMAGFYGTMIDTGLIRKKVAADEGAEDEDTLDGIPDTCGLNGFTDFTRFIDGLNNADGAAISARFPCIPADEVYAGPAGQGTGALLINRMSGTWIDRAELDASGRGLYLQTLSTTGGVAVASTDDGFTGPLDATCAAAVDDPCRYWQSRSAIYYVRNFTVAGDDLPCLARESFQPSGASVAPVAECLVPGAEDFHVQYGVDTTGNGVPDYYDSAPAATDMANVVAIQAHVLLRSAEPDGSYRNLKTYVLGDKVVTPGEDQFYRRVGSLALPLRNVQAQRTFQ
jgi:type IV pilus assembly protein PilW